MNIFELAAVVLPVAGAMALTALFIRPFGLLMGVLVGIPAGLLAGYAVFFVLISILALFLGGPTRWWSDMKDLCRFKKQGGA